MIGMGGFLHRINRLDRCNFLSKFSKLDGLSLSRSTLKCHISGGSQ